ncbi:adenylate/guanylate cyclase domain-containing protein [Skermania sp. ID1734]|uniref:adenylate/guanylate cyclase domain-containing protein n=1 Tax=Skermania sp. ID1734 TaxID=2597516 RepID=UPI00117FFE96|nr:adenylate/guanylate cyclase domain-containing protein [Skermania sp. ID1734]TSD93331.1 adenylate/guanylate cyclase domain-containing protein [Skermania sp. ID1734]
MLQRTRLFHRADTPLGSPLLGEPAQSQHQLRLRVQILLTALLLVANIGGVCIALVLLAWVVPGPDLFTPEYATVRYVVFPAYMVIAVTLGIAWATVSALKWLRWAQEERVPTTAEQVAALALPWRLTVMLLILWGTGAIVLGAAAGAVNPASVGMVVLTILFVGAAVAALSYVLSEFALRPIAARVLEAGDPKRMRLNGVRRRAIIAWMLGSGLPVTGLLIIAVFYFTHPVTATQLATSILAIGTLTLIFGALLTVLGGRATVDPLLSLINAMERLERNEPDPFVVVYDGTELGELQSGFNRMVEGLRERERIRELFGLHVGRDVAEAAMLRNPELGGEERTVGVFFIDIVGSTKIAFSRPPQEVVDLLNRMFNVVVEEVERFGGIINKFEGDAALAIFGAPVDLADEAGSVLAAARAVNSRLPSEVPDCTAAIGVSYGVAVAGNIGSRNRFEYTVIGDPINEAARLCELAKTVPGHLLASGPAVEAADHAEASNWRIGESKVLRGRDAETRLAMPITAPLS